jgi:hypothetical protein
MSAAENGASGGGSHAHTAIRAAGVAAASGAAALAARRAFGKSGGSGGSVGHALSAGLGAAWDAARDVILPTLEETVAAFGRYVADNAPDTVRDSLLPRFVDGFHEAREQREGDEADSARDKEKTTTGGDR